MIARYLKHTLKFNKAAGTSRNTLTQKPSWFILLEDGNKKGIGEVGIIPGLSPDDPEKIEHKLREVCERPEYFHSNKSELEEFPAIVFGLEAAFLSLYARDPFILFENDFSLHEKPIEINGLVWMGNKTFMKEQISDLIERGFTCIKMKIGAIDFSTELNLLKGIRKAFSKDKIELRVDANGAFTFLEALEKLKMLSELGLHSIEQPIAAGNWREMRELCDLSPVPIALDEELIGRNSHDIEKVLDNLLPQFIILKPGLHGGFELCDQWIIAAEQRGIGWWATSALESNIGLNAIAQWAANKGLTIPQGLGTGSLYSNNISSPLVVKGETLVYDQALDWDLTLINEKHYYINRITYSENELISYAKESITNCEEWEKEIFESILDWFNEEESIKFQTSGSTGNPKQIFHTKQSICSSSELTAEYFGLNQSSSILLCLPANYVAGKMMIYRALCLNCQLYWTKPISKPKIDQTYDLVSLVPLQMEKLLEDPDALSNIRNILIGGAPVRKQLKHKMLNLRARVVESYGMTETLTHVAMKELGEPYFKGLPSIEFKNGEDGLKILAPHISNNWLQTNDLVEMHGSDGFELVGRLDDVINSGGLKLHPQKIENKLEDLIKVPFYISKAYDEVLGERVILNIEGSEKDLDKEILKSALDKYEIPKDIVFVPTFERTFSGKLIKNKNE
ncbi:MAG: AMP-binding protein [Flavobacteriales bacterium]|nr:AMP-binding protein [Flavobacteriales bacterium]